MNSENIKNITNQAIEQLVEALKAGKSEALTNYLAAVVKFHRYSFQNILLIARQRFHPTAYVPPQIHPLMPGHVEFVFHVSQRTCRGQFLYPRKSRLQTRRSRKTRRV